LKKNKLYLPKDKWEALSGGDAMTGARQIEVDCPIDAMPVFIGQN